MSNGPIVRRISFDIHREFITQLAREWFYTGEKSLDDLTKEYAAKLAVDSEVSGKTEAEKPFRIPDSEKDEICRMKEKGISVEDIMAQTGRSRISVKKILNARGN